jgi:metal-responsive CopG/Arc/MetJ family transcriptional regulator
MRFLGCYVPEPLYEKVESYYRKKGFMSKSEFLRSLLRMLIEKEDD